MEGGKQKGIFLPFLFWLNKMNEKTLFLLMYFELMFSSKIYTLSPEVLFSIASRKKADCEEFLTCAFKQKQRNYMLSSNICFTSVAGNLIHD